MLFLFHGLVVLFTLAVLGLLVLRAVYGVAQAIDSGVRAVNGAPKQCRLMSQGKQLHAFVLAWFALAAGSGTGLFVALYGLWMGLGVGAVWLGVLCGCLAGFAVCLGLV